MLFTLSIVAVCMSAAKRVRVDMSDPSGSTFKAVLTQQRVLEASKNEVNQATESGSWDAMAQALHKYREMKVERDALYCRWNNSECADPTLCDYSEMTSEIIPPVSPIDCEFPGVFMKLEAGSQTDNHVRDFDTLMTFGTHDVTTVDGITVWDLDRDSLRKDSGPFEFVDKNYTQCAWVKWRRSSETGRTLFRGDNDHAVRVMHGGTQLGMWSSRQQPSDGSRFRATPFSITPDAWQFVCVVGSADPEQCAINGWRCVKGVSKFYVGDLTTKPVHVGDADRVVSGTYVQQIGFEKTHGPGKLASFYAWNRALSLMQVETLHSLSKPTIGELP